MSEVWSKVYCETGIFPILAGAFQKQISTRL